MYDRKKKERMHPETAVFAFLPIMPKYNQPEAYLTTTGAASILCSDDTGGSQTVWMVNPIRMES